MTWVCNGKFGGNFPIPKDCPPVSSNMARGKSLKTLFHWVLHVPPLFILLEV